MAERYVVVDGSNIATEGRSIPSLAQLDEAVRAFMAEHPNDQVIVVVDASFGYRIDESERHEYEQAEAAGEIVSPPAGAVGRGDGFLLRIADRTNATVLSNDSFQEFHGEYPWLFDTGRLIGGKPVPGVGWIFTLRTPVRGPRSREATRAADRARKAALKRAPVAEGPVAEAIAEATAEAIDPKQNGEEGEPAKVSRRTRRRRSKPAGTVNDPLPFIEFIAEHPLGTEVQGEVDSFTSHGAFVKAGDARCYVPLVALGDPPPRSAKEVLTRGETRTFVVQALDPPRRGIELALPGLVRVAGVPTEETVEADIGVGRRPRKGAKAEARAGDGMAVPAEAPEAATEAEEAVARVQERAKPARRSRKKAAAASEPVAADVAGADTAAVVPPAVPADAVAPEPEPVPPRKARATRKKQPAPVPAIGTDGEEAVVPAPARRRRRAPAPVPAEPEPRGPTPPEPEPALAAAAEAADRPVRRSRRRTAPAEDDARPPVHETPVPPMRRRAAAGDRVDEPAAEPVLAGPGGEPGAPSPPKRSRRRGTAAEPEPATPAPPTEALAAAPPPKRARRRATAPDEVPVGREPSPSATARTRRRAAAETVGPAPAAEPVPEAESEQGPPAKRTRARKVAAAGETAPVLEKGSRRRTATDAATAPEPAPAAKKAVRSRVRTDAGVTGAEPAPAAKRAARRRTATDKAEPAPEPEPEPHDARRSSRRRARP